MFFIVTFLGLWMTMSVFRKLVAKKFFNSTVFWPISERDILPELKTLMLSFWTRNSLKVPLNLMPFSNLAHRGIFWPFKVSDSV